MVQFTVPSEGDNMDGNGKVSLAPARAVHHSYFWAGGQTFKNVRKRYKKDQVEFRCIKTFGVTSWLKVCIVHSAKTDSQAF